MNLDVIKDQLADIIFAHLSKKQYRAFVFGSWASSTQKYYSDIDVGLEGKKPISLSTLGSINEKMENSNLPFDVDVVDFSRVPKSFKKNVDQNKIYL